jgi:hypothetical protein
MKADYDSRADAILITLEEVDGWEDEVGIDDAHLCGVALRDERPVAVSLRYPREQSSLLWKAARRFDLDAAALDSILELALSAPDKVVTTTGGRPMVDDEPRAA